MKSCIFKALFVSVLFLQNSCYGMTFDEARVRETRILDRFYESLKLQFIRSFQELAQAPEKVQSRLDGTPAIRNGSDIKAEALRQFVQYLQRSETRSAVPLIQAFVDGQTGVHFGINTLECGEDQRAREVALNLLRYRTTGQNGIMELGQPEELFAYRCGSVHDNPLFYSCPAIYSSWVFFNEFFLFLVREGGYNSLLDFTQGLFKERFSDAIFVDGLEAALDCVFSFCESFSAQCFPVQGDSLKEEVCAFKALLRITRQPIASAGPTILFPGQAPIA